MRYLMACMLVPIFIFTSSPVHSTNSFIIKDLDWSIEGEGAKQIVLVKALVNSSNGSGPDAVLLYEGNGSYPMFPDYVEDPDWISGVAFVYELPVYWTGSKDLLVKIIHNGSVQDSRSFTVDTDIGDEKEDGKVLGLPRWYCSISIIFITIGIIFLTWAYFKGRSVQRSREREGRTIDARCSTCGAFAPLGGTDCPVCGTVFQNDVFICGKCGSRVTMQAKACPSCGAKLLKMGS